MRRVLAVLAMVSCTVCGEVSGQTSPYVGQQTREIKALSAAKAKLTAEQIARYNELRGYSSTSAPQTHDPAKRHSG